MRISDWSSDVCSSDLHAADLRPQRNRLAAARLEHGFQDVPLGVRARVNRPANGPAIGVGDIRPLDKGCDIDRADRRAKPRDALAMMEAADAPGQGMKRDRKSGG